MTKYEVVNDLLFPHITIYQRVTDGIGRGYRANTDTEYVMYNPNAHDTEINSETGEEIPVIYYYTQAILPLNFNFDNFTYIAVPRNTVDENYIFGVPNDHETI